MFGRIEQIRSLSQRFAIDYRQFRVDEELCFG
jgi:hypothetical protein